MDYIALKDFEVKESYFKLIDKKLFSYFWNDLYKPLFEIMKIKPYKAQNSLNLLIEALKDGRIYYIDGVGFKALKNFTNKQSLELEKLGAKFDKVQKAYKIKLDDLPYDLRVFVAQAKILTEYKLDAIDKFLIEFQANIPKFIEQMLFTNEVVTILDDAGNEVKKNMRKINIIEPELTEDQKLEIAKDYTNNMKFYVEDWTENRIAEMRQKVQQLVLDGYREDKVQKMLQNEYHIGENKAKFLARNETGIMLSEYKKVTYQKAGFTHFKWQTITDGLERQLHKNLNGKIFRFDDPPIIEEEPTKRGRELGLPKEGGQRGLPQTIYNCRCSFTAFRFGSAFN